MPDTYLTVCETGAFVVSPAESTVVLLHNGGVGNVLCREMPGPIIDPQALFLCKSVSGAYETIATWKERNASSKDFLPATASWPAATFIGKAPHNLKIATPQQTLQLQT